MNASISQSFRAFPMHVLMFVFTLGLAGCELVGDVLKVGFWLGVVVLAVVVLAIWSVFRFARRKTRL